MTLRTISYIFATITIGLVGYYFYVYDVMTRETLQVLFVDSSEASEFRNILDEFTDDTNISVHVEAVPRSLYRTAIEREVASGETFDIVVAPSKWLARDVARDFYEDIHADIQNSWLYTSTGKSSSWLYGVLSDMGDALYAAPVSYDAYALAYRKDILSREEDKSAFNEKYGNELSVPDSLDILLQVATFYTTSSDTFGVAMTSEDVPDAYSDLLLSLTGDDVSPEAIESGLSYMKKLAELSIPQEENQDILNDDEKMAKANTDFMAGKSVFYIGSYDSIRAMRKTAGGEIGAEDIGVARLPRIEGSKKPYVQLYGASVVQGAKHRRAAHALIAWLGSRRADLVREENGQPSLAMLHDAPIENSTTAFFARALLERDVAPHVFPSDDLSEEVSATIDTYARGFSLSLNDFSVEDTARVIFGAMKKLSW